MEEVATMNDNVVSIADARKGNGSSSGNGGRRNASDWDEGSEYPYRRAYHAESFQQHRRWPRQC